MACTLTSESRRLYSWWWDSHISPKNSKWLQENLTDMDTKVKSMIKLIEEDADSFARRAEMYYKKRPELMKLVEEFYRAYRALAERYDYATSELRHAQKALQAAFPDQEPFIITQDSSSSSLSSIRPDAQNNVPFSLELFVEAKSQSTIEKDDCEVERLKKAVADLIAEKDSVFVQYQSSLGKLSNAESELIRAQESFKILGEKANEADKEVHMLKESLGLLTRLKSESDVDLLEKKIVITEEEANMLSEQAVKAEIEVEKLKNALLELTEEKEALQVLYAECLEKSFKLELDLSSAQSDVQRLTNEVLNGTKTLKQVEEICVCLETSNQSLKMEVSDLAKKIMLKDQELCVKHDEFIKKEVEFVALKEKLEEEVALQLGECTDMQIEIFNLKEEIRKLNMGYSLLTGQVELIGLNPDSFGLSLKYLQDENSRLKQTYEKRLVGLENHIQKLHKESKLKKEAFQEELDKAVIAQFENFILHKFVKEVEEENYILSAENEEHIKASKLSDKLISELETEILEQQVEEELLLVEVENLRLGIYQVFSSLEIGSKPEKISIEEIIGNINDLKRFLSKEEDDKQRVLIENTVISTLIQQGFQESELHYETMKDDFFKIKKENLDLVEVNENLGLELYMLDVEIEERKNIEENTISMLQERENEFELWNTEAAKLISDLQVSNTRDILFESKVNELAKTCESLEGVSESKDREIEEMKQKARVMEREIEGLKAQLLAYTPIICSLKENISSLEHNVYNVANLIVCNNRKAKDVEAKVNPHHNQSDPGPNSLDGISDLIEVQTRIAALEKVIVEDINTFRTQKTSGLDIKPKLPNTETEESKPKKEEKVRGKQRYLPLDHLTITKPRPELSEVRDIQLDQASDGSSSANSRSRSRRGYLRSDDILIEQLQIAHNSKLPYEPQIEDMGVHRLQLSNQESKKGKLLKTLVSDSHKLSNLETTVKDLAQRLEADKKIKKPTRVDFNILKEQLESAEESILQLANVNVKSIGGTEKNPFVEPGNTWKRSERIKTLQMDVQKTQCVLLKLDDEKKSKMKSRFMMSKNRTGVILRDFIHQGRNNNGRIRRRRLCGCFAPSPARSDRVKI
ncbi:hypothetical protein R6Q59_016187 [Mikania micrantha]